MPARRRLLRLLLSQRSFARRAAVWLLAGAGPPLLALGLVPLRSHFGLPGFLFSALFLVIVVALLGGRRPALCAVVLGFVAGAFLFAPPYDSLRVYLRLGNVPLVGFAVVGVTIAVLVDELARLAEEEAKLRRVDGGLRRVATLVARAALAPEIFAAVTREIGGLLPIERASMGRYEPDGTVTILAGWSRTGQPIRVGERGLSTAGDVGWLVAQSAQPARDDSYAEAPGWVANAFRGAGIRSVIGTPIVVDARLWGVMIAGSEHDGPLPADSELRLAGFTALLATAIANAESRAELAASRVRLVAAGDAARRQIERDLHDGAQQRLVALGLELRAAQKTLPPDLRDLDDELSGVVDGLGVVMHELREMARGIHPAILAQGGLGPAFRTLARRAGIRVELDVEVSERLPEPIEVAAYYIVSEALTNAAKYAEATLARVSAHLVGPIVRISVQDDGCGGADPSLGSGLVGLRDRVEALGGTITIHSPPGAGTRVEVDLPRDP